MKKHNKEGVSSSELLSSGLQTQIAFFKSLTEAPTLMAMFAIGLICFVSFVLFLYHMVRG